MPAAAWMTIAVAGLIIVFTAVGLIRIVLHLYAIRRTLTALTGGVRAGRPAHLHRASPAYLGQREP